MIPTNGQSSIMALILGWSSNGWDVLGLDWNTGKTVHQTIFGNENFGNGAYAILEYTNNDDLIFNSIVGPIRIHYDTHPSLKIENSVDPKTYFAVGDLLDCDYTVTNTGDVDIAGPITVTDSMFG